MTAATSETNDSEPEKRLEINTCLAIAATNPIETYSLLQYDQKEERRPPALIRQSLTIQHIGLPGRQGFYLGVFAGPLFSSIENPGMKKPGFDGGVLIGYAFSKKLSLETGLSRTKQYFSVSGDFLHKSLNIGGVKNIDGSRSAFSVPLKLKYNLVQ